MIFATNTAYSPIPKEEEIAQRCVKLHKRDDKAPFGVIGVLNDNGELRAAITTHTESEDAGITRFLLDNNFVDACEIEETDEDGNKTLEFDNSVLPDGFDALYRPAEG